jgi:hypothetical protein
MYSLTTLDYNYLLSKWHTMVNVFHLLFKSYNFIDSQKLLIKPFDRLRFFSIFVLVTVSSGFAIDLLFNGAAFDILYEKNKYQYLLATSIISSTFVGGFQTIGIFLIYYFSNNRHSFNSDIFPRSIVPIVQATGFCVLDRRTVSGGNVLSSPLALAPEILDYWDIQKLAKKLHKKIFKLWLTDLKRSTGKLSYDVGINYDGDIVYEPVDQNSHDNVYLTPLPLLVRQNSSINLEDETGQNFAKFKVVFVPPSTTQFHS